VRKGKKEIARIRKSEEKVTNFTSGAKSLLIRKAIHEKITRRVMISANPSGKVHHVMPQDSYTRTL
jgi:hypothetical protein